MSAVSRAVFDNDQWLRVVRETPNVKKLLRPRLTKYIPHEPHPPQSAFLLLNHVREILFGGAAGGGKSDALLMAALQYVDIPGYSALLLRRTTTESNLPGSIMDRAKEWLAGTDVHWNEQKKIFTFPSGARLSFGFMEHDTDRFRYGSAEYQFIGFDELTTFSEVVYTFMFSRMRRLKGAKVPIRMRGATNPIGEGADWVRERWGIGAKKKSTDQAKRIFIPSKISDNPSLDRKEYEQALDELDDVTKAQLLDGSWEVRPSGGKFRREHFRILDIGRERVCEDVVRYWDLASTDEKERKGKGPDWTVGVKMGRDELNNVIIFDVVRERVGPGEVAKLIRQTAFADGRGVKIRMSQDPGQAGVAQIDNYSRFVVPEYDFDGVKETGDKYVRGDILATKAFRGEVHLLRGHWNRTFLDECEIWPLGEFDDQVDAAEGARRALFEADTTAAYGLHVPGFGGSMAALTRLQIRNQIGGSAKRPRDRRTGHVRHNSSIGRIG